MFEAVQNCIRAFQWGEKVSPYQTDNVIFEGLLQQEKDLFFPDSKFLKMAFASSKKNRAMVALSKGYIHYTWNEAD